MASPPEQPRAWKNALAVLGVLLAVDASPTRAQQVTVGSDQILRIDGQKFFPVGLLQLGRDRYPNWNDRIRQSGANFVWDEGYAFADSMPSCAAIRDSADATGYKLMIGSFDTWEWDNPATPELEVAKLMYPADSLASVLSCFAGSKAAIAFSNRDEPAWSIANAKIGDVDSVHVRSTFTQLRAASPNRVVGIALEPVHISADSAAWISDLKGYAAAGNVVLFTSYPYPPGPGTCSPYVIIGNGTCPMDRLPDGLDAIAQGVKAANQPLWAIIQAHKGIPTKEARWEAYVSIIHGATGLIWAGHNWFHPLGDGSASWPVIAPVIAEVASLTSVLVNGKAAGISSGSPDLDVLAKNGGSGGVRYVFAASRRGASGDMIINVGANIQWIEVLFENRWLPVVNGQVIDWFADYEAHVYKIDASAAPPPAVAAEFGGELPFDGFALRVLENPSGGLTRAVFRVAEGTTAAFAVYDVAGRLLSRPEPVMTGTSGGWLTWDGRSTEGDMPSGVYFLRGTASTGVVATERIVLRR
ncbi:MAG: hypothetical protein ACT4PE_16875 [Candidatus Eiseniibacteriota bacterium]